MFRLVVMGFLNTIIFVVRFRERRLVYLYVFGIRVGRRFRYCVVDVF